MADPTAVLEDSHPLADELHSLLVELRQIRSHRLDRERLGLLGPAVPDALLVRIEHALARSLRRVAPDRS